MSQACLRYNRRNLGVCQKPHGHANYLIFTEINVGAVLTIDQNMGTRVLGMRDLTYPTGTSTQICRPHSHKKSNHDFLHGITTLAFYPVASLFSGGRGNLPVLIATGMGNLPVPPCMLMEMVYHKVSMVLFKLPQSMGVVFLHLPGGSVGSSKVNLSKYLSTRAIR